MSDSGRVKRESYNYIIIIIIITNYIIIIIIITAARSTFMCRDRVRL